ncbi:MAG: hypothetical protein Q9163_002493 [Psora crenata]
MPYPQAKPDDPVHLQTFDPKTFYPAVAARHSNEIRNDSVSTFPARSICEPDIPKNFDPATFYPALAARERLKGRVDSMFVDSVYLSRPMSQATITTWERPQLGPCDSDLYSERKRTLKKLWTIGIFVFVATVIIILVIAWLGAHNFFQDRPVTFP